MTLKELIDGVGLELKSAGLNEAEASLSLAFSARKESDGTVACEFVENSALSNRKAGELHRLEVILPASREETPRKELKTGARPIRIRLREESALDRVLPIEDLETPAIYRAAAAAESNFAVGA